MKFFFDGKKVPAIPSLLFHSSFVIYFQEKAHILKQCTLVSYNSVLPREFT